MIFSGWHSPLHSNSSKALVGCSGLRSTSLFVSTFPCHNHFLISVRNYLLVGTKNHWTSILYRKLKPFLFWNECDTGRIKGMQVWHTSRRRTICDSYLTLRIIRRHAMQAVYPPEPNGHRVWLTSYDVVQNDVTGFITPLCCLLFSYVFRFKG